MSCSLTVDCVWPSVTEITDISPPVLTTYRQSSASTGEAQYWPGRFLVHTSLPVVASRQYRSPPELMWQYRRPSQTGLEASGGGKSAVQASLVFVTSPRPPVRIASNPLPPSPDDA